MNVINNVVIANKTSAFADMGVYKTNALPIASTTVLIEANAALEALK